MAVLSDADRLLGAGDFMREVSADSQACAITKPQLRAAFNALDQFLSDNAAAINTALPVAARNGLTTPQKARLLQIVIQRRYRSGV